MPAARLLRGDTEPTLPIGCCRDSGLSNPDYKGHPLLMCFQNMPQVGSGKLVPPSQGQLQWGSIKTLSSPLAILCQRFC